MKITNKYDMLEAMDGINEEYIRRANKLLEKRRAGGEVNRAEITPLRFSWKSIAAAAACLAVFIGGAFGIKALMNKPQIDNPSEVITPAQQAYLEKKKAFFGAQGSVDFARNKLDIKEYDISDFESMPVLVDKSHTAVTVKDNNGYPELRLHDLKSGEQTVLYSNKNDPEITSETDIDVLYANKDYVVFDIKFYAGATLDKRELRMAAVKGNKSYTAYTMYGVGVDNRMVIVDDTLYFNTYIGEHKNNEIYRYRIGADEKAEKVVEGYNLRTYNGKVYYYTSGNESGFPEDPLAYTVYINFHVLDGELPFDTKKYSGMLMTGKCGIFDTRGNKVSDCVNDMVLLSGGKAKDLFAIPLDSMLLVKADDNKAVYDMKTGELLVFEEDDGLYNTIFDYDDFDGGMYTVKMDNDAYSKLCVITEKGENTPEIVDPSQQYLNEMKALFGAQVNVAYARDRLNIVEFDMPEGLELSGIESKSPIILSDSNRIIVKRITSSGDAEVAAYLIDSGEYEILHGVAENPGVDLGDKLDVSICYANKDYVVFLCDIYRGAAIWRQDLRVVELNADSDGSHRWYSAYSMEDGSAGSGCVIIGNDLYFHVYPDLGYQYYNAPIYRYEIGGSKKAEQVAEGGTLAAYNGELYYYRENDDYVGMSLFSLNGELPYNTDKHGVRHVSAGRCGIFYSWNFDGTITDCVTDKVILSGGSLSWMGANAYDFLISIGDYYNRALYNTNTDELLVLDKNDPLYTYGVVMAGFDGGACGYSGGRDEPVKLYIITEKGENTPEVEKTYKAYVPVVSSSEVLRISETDAPDFPHQINGHVAYKHGTIKLNGTTYVLMALYEPDGMDSGPEIEYGVYDPETKAYTTLISGEVNGGSLNNMSRSEKYLVFSSSEGCACIGLDLTSDTDISKFKVIRIGEGLEWGMDCVMADDGLLYFEAHVSEPYSSGIYSFDPATGETKYLVDGAHYPLIAGGKVFYHMGSYGEKTVSEIGGGYSFKENDIFLKNPLALLGIKEMNVGGRNISVMYNMLTGENIIAADEISTEIGGSDSLINLRCKGSDGNEVRFSFDLRLNMLIEYDESYWFFHTPEWSEDSSDIGTIEEFVVGDEKTHYYTVTVDWELL